MESAVRWPSKEILQPATSETIKNILVLVEPVIKKGNNNFGSLDPDSFDGYYAYHFSQENLQTDRLTISTVIRIRLKRFLLDKGIKEIEYEISEEEGKLRMDRYDFFITNEEIKKNEEISNIAHSQDIGRSFLATRELAAAWVKRNNVKKVEKKLGLSFVGEAEAAYVLTILQEIVEANNK